MQLNLEIQKGHIVVISLYYSKYSPSTSHPSSHFLVSHEPRCLIRYQAPEGRNNFCL